MKQHGDTVAGKKIELIRKDNGGIAPDVAKRLAQEAIVRDDADILAGFELTPNALAVGRRLRRSEEIHGGDERRHLDHHHQVALHRPHLVDDAAIELHARHLGGQERLKTVYTMVSDYGPASTPRPGSRPASRTPAARSSARSASRWRTRISPPSSRPPRTRTRTPSTSGFPAAPSRPPSARRWLNAASTPKTKVLGQDALAFETALKAWATLARHHHGVGLRLQSPVGDEQGFREGL